MPQILHLFLQVIQSWFRFGGQVETYTAIVEVLWLLKMTLVAFLIIVHCLYAYNF